MRRLVRAPAYSLGVIATIAVALGAATAVAILLRGVLLRPLGYPEPDRLVHIALTTPGMGTTGTGHSSGTYAMLRERTRTLSGVAAYMENAAVTITEGDTPERVGAGIVTPSFFPLLGVVPVTGRFFEDNDALQPLPPVVISFDLWQRRFGGDPDIAGKTVELNRTRRTILGVAPRHLDLPSRETALFYPDSITATNAGLSYRYLNVIGRLRDETTMEQAQAEVSHVASQLPERFPDLSRAAFDRALLSMPVEGLREAIVAPVRGELGLLGLAVILVLLAAIANVSTLTLVRAARLTTEASISRALGADRADLVRRFVVEGLIVSLAGAMIAVPLARLLLASRFGFAEGDLPRLDGIAFGSRAAFAMLVAAGALGAFLGILGARRSDEHRAVSLSGIRTTRGRGWRRMQDVFVGSQVAGAMVLLCSAGIVAVSFARLRATDLGFRHDGRAKFAIQLPFRGYDTYQRTAAFHARLSELLQRTPGIRRSAIAMELPSTPQGFRVNYSATVSRDDGRVVTTPVSINVVSTEYFRVIGTNVLQGRALAAGDLLADNPGVVISRTLAGELFGEEDPVGRELRLSSRYPAYRIVGVSGDVYSDAVWEGPLKSVYFPLIDELPPTSTERESRIPVMPGGVQHVLETDLPVSALMPFVRGAVASIDPRLAVWGVQPLGEIVDAVSARTRLATIALGIASLATLLLVGIGLYSTVAYAMSGRRREIAVRQALGASPASVVKMVLMEGALVVGAGVLLGGVLSAAARGVLASLLHGAVANGALLGAGAALVVMLVGALALLSPAINSSRVDAAGALRGDQGA